MDRYCEVCRGNSFRTLGEKVGHTFVRCEECGLERIDPPPTDEELAKVYGEHYYDAWGLKRDEEAVERLKRATFATVVSEAGALKKGARVLDCGAATGFLMQVASDAGYEAYGIELSEFGAGKIGERFGKDRVFQGEIENASFAGLSKGCFDAIFMCDYIEHVRDPERVLRHAYDWLAPGGMIVISTPRVGSLTHRAMGLSWTHYKVEHLYYFSRDSLERLLCKTGFVGYGGRALVKTMNLDYVTHQFSVYPHKLLTPAVNALRSVLPDAARRAPFPISMGELLAKAHKPAAYA